MRTERRDDVPREFRPLALGYTMAFSSTPPVSLVTASLTLDFAGTAKVGDWLETHVDASAVFLVTGSLEGDTSA